MKNMKRALSLVLTMVMLLGMMVIPTGAASNFKDAAEIKYDEAVEVTSGLGLFAGADGNFMPKGTVTRAQMATIIVKMFHGAQANADTFKRLNGSFPDIASFEGGWAEGYINWCSSMGAVAGYGDGTFKPGQAVTTAEAVTMIINAMGIDAGEGQWPLTVMAKADELKLFKDISPKPDTNKALTREELAVISLNAIQYSADGKIGYEYNGEVYNKYIDAYLAAGQDGSLVNVAKNGSLASDVFGLKTAEGFITGNQATGLEYTEVKGFIEGVVATYKFAIESDLDDIGHYVTVYYSEQYKTEKEPGLAYSIVDESTAVVVEEPITTYTKYRDAFGSREIPVAASGFCFDDAYNGTAMNGNMAIEDEQGNDYAAGNSYYVPAGTYVIYDKEIVAYQEPVTVYASRVVSIVTTTEDEEVMLMGVNEVLYNSEGNDQIQEYVGMKAQDYVTYVKAQDQYILSRVSVVRGMVSDISVDDQNRQVLNVNGTKYTAFTGDNDTGKATNINVNGFNYDTTYDIYVDGDKFIFCDVASGGLNLDDVVYILGSLTIEKEDSYGEPIVETYARGVDMKGKEVMVLVGLTINNNVICADPGLEQGFYTVANHSDRDAKKEGVKELTGFAARYDSQTKAPFVSEYYAGANDMIYTGAGSYGAGYSFNQSTTAYVVLDGTIDQSTPLETSASTGSISVTLDREGNHARPIALITRTDEGVNMLEAVVILSDLSTATGKQTIYVSQDSLQYTGRTATGYSYDVYSATTGAVMTITTREATLPVQESGFYRVAKNAEDGIWEFYLTGDAQVYKVPSTYGETGGAAGWKDGINDGNVAYGQTFDYIRSDKMYGSSSDVITKVRTVTGAAVIDLRSEEQIALDKVPAITSVDQLTALKTSRPDVAIFFDTYVNVSGTNVIKTIFITNVRDGSVLVGNNSVLYAATELPTTGDYTFYVAESSSLGNGDTLTLTMDGITVKPQTGTAIPSGSALYEYAYDGVTNTHTLTALVASHGGEGGGNLGYFGYTQGLHKIVSGINGNTMTVASNDAGACGLACSGKYAAPLTLLPSASTAVVDLRVNRHGGAEITSWSQFKAELNEGGTVFYVDYYQPSGLGLTSSRPADCIPSLIVITDSDRPLIKANTLLMSKGAVKSGAAATFLVVDGNGYTLGQELSLTADQVALSSGHTGLCATNETCDGFFRVVGGDDTSVVLEHVGNDTNATREVGIHNIVTRWISDGVVVTTDGHTYRGGSSSNNHLCDSQCFNASSSHGEASKVLDLTNGNIPVIDLVDGTITSVAALKAAVTPVIGSAATIQANGGENGIMINYWCADGGDDETPEIIFVVGKNAPMLRKNNTTIIWRSLPGEVIYASSAITSHTVFSQNMGTAKVYGVESLDDGTSVFLQVNTIPSKKGLFQAVENANGFGVFVEVEAVALTQALPDNAVIVAGPTGATTAAVVNAILAGGGSVTAAVAVGTNGITYVYVTAAS